MSHTSYHVVRLKIPESSLVTMRAKLYDDDCLGLEKESTASNEMILKAYFKAETPLSELLEFMEKKFPEVIELDGTTIGLYEDESESLSFEPFELTKNFSVYPPNYLKNEKPLDQSKTIFIRRGLAFGTGKHETTQMVAEAMISYKNQNHSLLDVGSGSGILSILAEKIGFEKIRGVETDEKAQKNGLENFSLNQCSKILLSENIQTVQENYEMIVANLLTPTILYLQEKILQRLEPNGILILSGITRSEENQIREAFQDHNLLELKHLEEWCCFVYQKNQIH